jgi:hypothetical protein
MTGDRSIGGIREPARTADRYRVYVARTTDETDIGGAVGAGTVVGLRNERSETYE